MNLNKAAYIMNDKVTVILIIVAVSFVLRMPYLGKPLIKDEGRVYKCIGMDYGEIIEFIIKEEAHPPLYYYMAKAWSKMHTSYFWMRFLSVIFGALTPGAIYLIALNLYTDDKVAVLSGFISAVSPNLIFISQILRSYSAATFMTACASLFFIIYFKKRSPIFLSLYALASTLSSYTYYFSMLMVVGIALFFLIRIKDFSRTEIISFLTANFFIASICSIWAPSMIEQMGNALRGSGSHLNMMMANRFGMYIGKIHVGAIVKGLAGVFQIDNALFSNIRLHMRLSLPVLGLSVIVASLGLLYVIMKGCGYLVSVAKMASSTLFLIVAIFVPYSLAVLLNITKGFGIIQRHMGPCAVLSSVILSGFILSFKSKTGKAVLVALMMVFFAVRIIDIWGYHDKEYKALDAFVLKEKRADVLVSREADFFKNNERYNGMRIIELREKDIDIAKDAISGCASFYLVEFNRPINLIEGRAYYENAKAHLVQDYELVKSKAIDDVVSVELYKKR